MRYIKKSLLLTSSIVIILIICEIFLRVQQVKTHAILVSKYKNRNLCFHKDPHLLYALIPNKCGANSHGYFDYEHTFIKPKNVFRIVIIGDSLAQGQGVKLDETFGQVLRKKLDTTYSNKKIEVITLAVSGYSLCQEISVLKEQASKYTPDLIIWSYVLNDPAHPLFHDVNGELARFFYEPKIHLLHFISKKLFYFREKLISRCMHCEKMEYHAFLHCVYWNGVKSGLKTIGEIKKNLGIPILFVIHPLFEENRTFDEYSLLSLHAKLKAAAYKQEFLPVDLLDVYKNYKPEELKQNSDIC